MRIAREEDGHPRWVSPLFSTRRRWLGHRGEPASAMSVFLTGLERKVAIPDRQGGLILLAPGQ
jgi:hypothetical protein